MSLMEGTRGSPALEVVVDLESVDEPETVHSSCSVENDVPEEVVVVNPQSSLTCEVCATPKPVKDFHTFDACGHSYCTECVETAFHYNVTESKVNLKCLSCDGPATAEEIRSILNDELYQKYLDFTLRQYLAKESDVVYCQAPDCTFACITVRSKPKQPDASKSKQKSKSNSSPQNEDNSEDYFVCRRESCGHEQCLKCMEDWHGNEPCKDLRRGLLPTNMKPCPTCNVPILKNQDGSCNQMTCTVCRTSFCWLCGQRVSEMHFLSPSGCPLFGTQMWSSKRRLCCKISLFLTAPFLVVLLSFLAFPVTLILFPLIISYMAFNSRAELRPRSIRIVAAILTAIPTILVAPFVALIVSILVVPVSFIYLCICVPIT